MKNLSEVIHLHTYQIHESFVCFSNDMFMDALLLNTLSFYPYYLLNRFPRSSFPKWLLDMKILVWIFMLVMVSNLLFLYLVLLLSCWSLQNDTTSATFPSLYEWLFEIHPNSLIWNYNYHCIITYLWILIQIYARKAGIDLTISICYQVISPLLFFV